MIDIDSALTALRIDILKIAQLEKDRIDLSNSGLNAAMRDERDQDIKNDIEKIRRRMVNLLEQVIDFPPQHLRHDSVLDQFHAVASFEKSVFIMTKFPNTKKPSPTDLELNAVIQAVKESVESCGYTARLASDNQYHPILWDNVELYLLGCKRGIAIVEDKYLPEMNPNVAMEWGWMRVMGRDVLYLVEKDFKHERADWGGLIQCSFDWGNPKPDILVGVEDWLKK